MKRILVFGSSGLTGYKTVQLAERRNFEVYGTYNARKTKQGHRSNNMGTFLKLNLNQEDSLTNIFNNIKPDVVLNCIALHNVDYCESNPQDAFFINSKVVRQMVDLCNLSGSRFIHISTDFVFDGQKRSAYIETDEPSPINVYAKSKLNGELEAMKSDSYAIIRPSVIYGWTPFENLDSKSSSGKPMNFGLWAIHKMKNSELINVVNDQYTTPTLADTLASICLRIASTNKNEIYHVAGVTCISRYEFATKIAEIMGYSPIQIKAIETKNLNQRAARPQNSCLDCSKVQKETGIRLPDIEQSLFTMRSQIELEGPELLGN